MAFITITISEFFFFRSSEFGDKDTSTIFMRAEVTKTPKTPKTPGGGVGGGTTWCLLSRHPVEVRGTKGRLLSRHPVGVGGLKGAFFRDTL